MVEFSAGNRWFIWRVDINTLSANSEYKLNIIGVDQAKFMPGIQTIKAFIVSGRELIREIRYADPDAITPAAILSSEFSLTADEVAATKVPKKKYQRWKLGFNHANSEIPQGGVIKITLSAEFTNMDKHCYNAGDSELLKNLGNDITCYWDVGTSSYYIKNFLANDVTKFVSIYFYA